MKKKAARIFTAFIMTAIIAQGTVMVANAAETDSTPDSIAVVEVATPDSSALESGADSTSSFTFVQTLIKCIISSFYMCFVIDYPHNPIRS